MKELLKFTPLLRERTDYFTSRYSERKADAAKDAAAADLAQVAMQHEAPVVRLQKRG